MLLAFGIGFAVVVFVLLWALFLIASAYPGDRNLRRIEEYCQRRKAQMERVRDQCGQYKDTIYWGQAKAAEVAYDQVLLEIERIRKGEG